MKLNDTDIQGDLSVSRHSNVGGNQHVNGNAFVGHDLTVKGWLEATNIKGPDKGLYRTEALLKAAYPKPQPGWSALVGPTLPAELYVVENGQWVGTGMMTGLPTPKITYVDCGIWDPERIYYFETLNPETGIVETSDVWYMGCRYRCQKTGTHQQPKWMSSDWIMIEGNPEVYVMILPLVKSIKTPGYDVTLNVSVTKFNRYITGELSDEAVVWTRYSENADGTPRTLSDEVWNMAHQETGMELHLTDSDLGLNGGRLPKIVQITATVTLPGGDTDQASINMLEQ